MTFIFVSLRRFSLKALRNQKYSRSELFDQKLIVSHLSSQFPFLTIHETQTQMKNQREQNAKKFQISKATNGKIKFLQPSSRPSSIPPRSSCDGFSSSQQRLQFKQEESLKKWQKLRLFTLADYVLKFQRGGRERNEIRCFLFLITSIGWRILLRNKRLMCSYGRSLLLLIILIGKESMSNFNPFLNMYCQFWMVPNMFGTGTPYFAPVAMYPQFVQPQTVIPSVNASQDASTAKLAETPPKPEEKIKMKTAQSELQENPEPQKITVQIESNFSKQVSVKNEEKKPKRPQTYLTQKAFYMKQKLKGKHKNGMRILRKRQKIIEQPEVKVVEVQKAPKKAPSDTKVKRKKMPIMKDSQKQKKIMLRIRQKLLNGSLDEFAKIPKPILGVMELNQFCRRKFQNLMRRQLNKE